MLLNTNGSPLSPPPNAIASPATAHEIASQLERDATTPQERTAAHNVLLKALEADRHAASVGLHLPGLAPARGGGPVAIDGDTLLKSLTANSLKPKGTAIRINHTLDALGEYTGIRDAATLTSKTMAFLEAVSRTPAVQLIIRKRVAQVQRFCRRPRFRGDMGMGIKQREERRQLTGTAAKERDALEDFVLHGGYRYDPSGKLRRRAFDGRPGVWDGNEDILAGGLLNMCGIMTRNALALDWAPVRMEPGNDADAMPVAWFSNADVDAKQIRRTWEKKYVPQIDQSGLPIAYVELEPGSLSGSAGMVCREFPWNRMAVMVRNPRTDFFGLGYGFSETEAALDVLASMILNLKFRAEYFDNNHIPPAIVTLRGQLAGFSDNSLNALRTQLAMKTGNVGAFFKLLYLGLPPGSDNGIEIHPLRNATGAVNEMEYAHSDFQALMTLLCALFLIDPAEVGFKNDGGADNVLSESDPESRLVHSKESGLEPLLTAISDFINTHIIQFLNPDFEFVWHGLTSNTMQTDEKAAQARWQLGDTANELKDAMDRPRDMHAKDVNLWTKTSRKFKQEAYATPEEWHDAVDTKYEKEFEAKYGDEADAWSTAWDEPSGSPEMMRTIEADKQELAGAKAQQKQVQELIEQGHSPEEAKKLAAQNAMMAQAGMPGQGDPAQGGADPQEDGGPLSRIPRDGDGSQQNAGSPFDTDALKAPEDDTDPYQIEEEPSAPMRKSQTSQPTERVIRIVRV
ncbi:hypothetical protein EON83_10895 [bacterium]|nr:MAG: hypothetical protein EON83_10895 [bacterium]